MLQFLVTKSGLTREDSIVLNPAIHTNVECIFTFSDDLVDYSNRDVVFSVAGVEPQTIDLVDGKCILPQAFINDSQIAVMVKLSINNALIETNYVFIEVVGSESSDFRLPLVWDMDNSYYSEEINGLNFETIFGKTSIKLIQPQIFGKKNIIIETNIGREEVPIGSIIYAEKQEDNTINIRFADGQYINYTRFNFKLERYSELYHTPYVSEIILTGGSGSGGVEEAPKDGQQYARENGTWTVVETPEGVKVYNQEAEPTEEIKEGDIWISTSGSKVYNGTAWLTLGSEGSTPTFFDQNTTPSGAKEGDFWKDWSGSSEYSSSFQLKYFRNSSWELISPSFYSDGDVISARSADIAGYANGANSLKDGQYGTSISYNEISTHIENTDTFIEEKTLVIDNLELGKVKVGETPEQGMMFKKNSDGTLYLELDVTTLDDSFIYYFSGDKSGLTDIVVGGRSIGINSNFRYNYPNGLSLTPEIYSTTPINIEGPVIIFTASRQEEFPQEYKPFFINGVDVQNFNGGYETIFSIEAMFDPMTSNLQPGEFGGYYTPDSYGYLDKSLFSLSVSGVRTEGMSQQIISASNGIHISANLTDSMMYTDSHTGMPLKYITFGVSNERGERIDSYEEGANTNITFIDGGFLIENPILGSNIISGLQENQYIDLKNKDNGEGGGIPQSFSITVDWEGNSTGDFSESREYVKISNITTLKEGESIYDSIPGSRVYNQGSEPSVGVKGDIWVLEPGISKIHNGTEWVSLSEPAYANQTKGDTIPSNPQPGDIWIDTGNNLNKVYNGTEWLEFVVPVGSGGSGDSGISVFNTTSDAYAPSPSGAKVNDLWFGSEYDNFTIPCGFVRIFNGSTWDSVIETAPLSTKATLNEQEIQGLYTRVQALEMSSGGGGDPMDPMM